MTAEHPTALVVVSHHRPGSLTAAVAARAAERLTAAGYRIDVLDLHAEGWDPRNRVADEPDYGAPDKRYTDVVHAHIERVYAADVIVVAFPVWWFSLPALLKGWIDRVWNHGLTYTYGEGRSPVAGKRMLWLGLAALNADHENADLIHSLMDGTLKRGISGFCGIEDAGAVALFNSEGHGVEGPAREKHYRELFATVEESVEKLLAAEPALSPL